MPLRKASIALVLLAVLLTSVPALRKPAIKTEGLREHLLEKRELQSITPTADPFALPVSLYDVALAPDVPQVVTFSSKDVSSARVRLPNLSRKEFSIELLSDPGKSLSLSIEDSLQRRRLVCEGLQCSDLKKIELNSEALLKITILPGLGVRHPLGMRMAVRGKEKAVRSLSAIPQIRLSLSALEVLHLDQLSTLAFRASQKPNFYPPKQTLHGEILGEVPSEVRLQISGRTSRHFVYPPSLKVNIMKGPAIFGTKEFKLYRFETRQGLYDLVASSIAQDIGLKAPMTQLVEVVINGTSHGLYILEEQFSPSFFEHLKLNEGRVVSLDPDRLLAEDKFPRYVTRLNYGKPIEGMDIATREFLSKVDPSELTKYIAFIWLFSGIHALGADDLRFYQDPLTGKYLPLLSDLKVGLGYENRWAGKHLGVWELGRLPSPSPWKRWLESLDGSPFETNFGKSLGIWDVHPAVSLFLSEEGHKKEVFSEFHRLQSAQLKEKFISRFLNLDQELSKMSLPDPQQNLLKAQKMQVARGLEGVYQGEENPAFNQNTVEKDQIYFERSSVHFAEDRVTLVYTLLAEGLKQAPQFEQLKWVHSDSRRTFPYSAMRVSQKKEAISEWVVEVDFKLHRPQYLSLDFDSVVAAIGNRKVRSIVVYDVLVGYLPERREITPAVATALPLFEAGKSVHIDSLIHVPQGKRLQVPAGAELIMGEKGGFVVEGEIQFLGSKQEPIRIYPGGKDWQGIVLQNSNANNVIRYVEMRSARGVENLGMRHFGGVSIFRSTALIEHSSFRQFKSVDCINLFHSHVIAKNIEIEEAKDDGFDSDFSYGEISNSSFVGNGGDGVDLNQSFFRISDNKFIKNHDKGISVGEQSVALMVKNQFNGNHWGVGVKDAALATITENTFFHHDLAIAKLIKKPWYGKPLIIERENLFSENGSDQEDLGFLRY